MQAKVQRCLLALAGCSLLAACGPSVPPSKVAQELQVTSRTTERYHVLAQQPFSALLGHDGYVVGIEKVPRGIAHPGSSHPYLSLIHCYAEPAAGRCPEGIEAKNVELAHQLNNRFEDDKVMVVTHVLAYGPSDGDPGTRFLYNVYDEETVASDGWREVAKLDDGTPLFQVATDAGVHSPILPVGDMVQPPSVGSGGDYFGSGLDALRGTLEKEIREKLRRAAAAGRPYTHLVLGSMGWDNDQAESVRRYGATMAVLLEARRRDGEGVMAFRPLFVGVTWPSVWGWTSWFDFGQLTYKLFGYGNKADDSDEVGYTLFNDLLNGMARDLKAEYAGAAPLRIVAFGHSFGARLVSRAVFSDNLLRDEFKTGERPEVDLFIGLQPAFSINRFIRCREDAEDCGREGSPYGEFRDRRTKIVLTSSRHDAANPLAQYLTRAKHVGGGPALELAREHTVSDGSPKGIFQILDYAEVGQRLDTPGTCSRLREQNGVVLVDAASFVFGHNDVLDLETGELLWSAVRCFAPTAKASTTARAAAVGPAIQHDVERDSGRGR